MKDCNNPFLMLNGSSIIKDQNRICLDGSSLQHHEQNKCYPRWGLHAHFEASIDFKQI